MKKYVILFSFMFCMFGCDNKYVFTENELIKYSNIMVEMSYECVENGSTLEECKNFIDLTLNEIMKEK